jgi:hypothetical protein
VEFPWEAVFSLWKAAGPLWKTALPSAEKQAVDVEIAGEELVSRTRA